MTQTYDDTYPGSALGSLASKLQDTVQTLRSLFSGAAAPTGAQKAANMLAHVTATKTIDQRNEADSAWNPILAANVANHTLDFQVRIGALAGSDDRFVFAAPLDFTCAELVIISDTATSGSDGSNNWAAQVANLTAANDLLATAWNSNGDELAADGAKVVTLDQNQAISQNDVIEVQFTQTGSPTALSSAEILVSIRGKLTGSA